MMLGSVPIASTPLASLPVVVPVLYGGVWLAEDDGFTFEAGAVNVVFKADDGGVVFVADPD